MLTIIDNITGLWIATGLFYVCFAACFFALVRVSACNTSHRYWHSKDVLVDLIYWFIIPIFSKYVKLLFLFLITQQILGLTSDSERLQHITSGYGPLGELPIWLQCVLIVIASDIIFYWTHRLFHSKHLWKFHAIHHSPKEFDWPSALRFHPINSWLTFTLGEVLLLLCGFAPEAFIYLVPFNIFYSAMVHANLNWTFGPFKYVFASPVFHRWHHTLLHEGGNRNFAPTFPVLDLIFGTFYMPEGKQPEIYGVNDELFPAHNFIGQMLYPFKK